MKNNTVVRFLIAALVLNASIAHAEPEFSLTAALTSCPFYNQKDPYNFNGLAQTVKAGLESKVAKDKNCVGPLNGLLANLRY